MLMYNGGGDVVTAATGLGTVTDRESAALRKSPCLLQLRLLAARMSLLRETRKENCLAWLLSSLLSLPHFLYSLPGVPPTACISMRLLLQ